MQYRLYIEQIRAGVFTEKNFLHHRHTECDIILIMSDKHSSDFHVIISVHVCTKCMRVYKCMRLKSELLDTNVVLGFFYSMLTD